MHLRFLADFSQQETISFELVPDEMRCVNHSESLAVSMAGIKLGDRLLVVGCGDPVLLARLGDKTGLTGRAFGVDEREAVVATAANVATREGALVETATAPWTSLPIENGSFDVAVVRDVWLRSPLSSCGVCRGNCARTSSWRAMSRHRWTVRTGMSALSERLRSRRLRARAAGADLTTRVSGPRACSPSARGFYSRKRSSQRRLGGSISHTSGDGRHRSKSSRP